MARRPQRRLSVLDGPAAHARNLAHTQQVLGAAGGWPVREGPGWVAGDAALPSRFFSAGVLTDPTPDPAITVPALAAARTWTPGPHGAVVFDTWGRPPGPGCASAVLMVRPPGSLPPTDPRVHVVADRAGLRLAEQALAPALENPAFASCGAGAVFGPRLLDAPVALAVGVVDDGPVAVALAVDDGVTIGVYLVGVAPGWRRAGLGAAVSAAVVGALAPRPALLSATVLGRPVYEGLGWRATGSVTLWRVPLQPA